MANDDSGADPHFIDYNGIKVTEINLLQVMGKPTTLLRSSRASLNPTKLLPSMKHLQA